VIVREANEDFVYLISDFSSGLLKTDGTTSNAYEPRAQQSQSVGPPVMPSMRNGDISSSNTAEEYTNKTKWKRTGFETVSFIKYLFILCFFFI
jgi:hypothetical protein